MTNPKEEKIKLTESGVITEAALLAYLHDKLSPEDRHEMERLLKDDPFAQEAFEGLKSAQNKTVMEDSLSSIRKKVYQRMDKKEKRFIQIHWTNYAWAAAILGLLISLGSIMVVYLGKRNEDIALNKEQNVPIVEQKKEEPKLVLAPAVVGDTSAAKNTASQSLTTVTATEQTEVKPAPAPEVKTKSAETVKLRKDTTDSIARTKNTGKLNSDTLGSGLFASNAATAKRKADKSIAQNEVAAPVSNNAVVNKGNMSSAGLTNNEASNRMEANNFKATNSAVATTGGNQISTQEAMKTFYTGDYKKSEEQFDQVLKQQPESPEALFFGGVSDYVNGDLTKAENNFDALLKQHKKFMDGAKWYKANILLKHGDKQKAKKMLEELSQTGGSYKERAQKRLSETQF